MSSMSATITSVNDIQNILYINLESRPDRKQMAISEFEKLGWASNPTWFKAIKTASGAIGCTLSHIKCLEYAKQMNWTHVLICEDDIKFTQPKAFTEYLNQFLASGIDWDVILVAGNNAGKYMPTEQGAVRVQACQTTTGYLVKYAYFDILIRNFKEGVAKLMRAPANRRDYAIDRYWFSLQNIHLWYLIYPLTVTQQSDYSDIENRHTNYDKMMLTLDKSDWFKRK